MATEPLESTDQRNVGGEGGDAELHATALRHAHEAWRAEQFNIAEGREDQRFAFGDQWPANDKLDRDRERRPSIVINRLPQFKRQVTGDIRKDTPASKVLPSKDATKGKAEILSGMIRNIEQQSNAKAAYVQAVENAVDVGMGCWRILTEYESDNAFEQVIRIKRIQDPFGVLFGPATEPDKSDAPHAFVFDDIPEDDFKRQYPEASLDNFPSPPEGGMIWRVDKTIRIAEYWYKEQVTKTLELLEDGSTRYKEDKDDDETADTKEGLPAPPLKVIRSREVKAFEVKHRLMNGREWLAPVEEWAGRYIPLVPMVGEEARIDGRTLRKGMVRDAKGPQQVYNYMRTAAAEYVGKQPAAPFTGTIEMFAGLEHIWQEAGTANHAYLPHNHDPRQPQGPQRSMPPSGATGLDQQAVIAAGDIEAVIGIYKESLGAQSNANSGRAILARQREGDTGTFFYIDNLRTALTYSSKILLDLIPKIYDTPRTVRTLKEDGTHDMVSINRAPPPGMEPDDLEEEVRETLNDLSIGEYDVIVSTGPGYASKRQESSESMTNFMQAYPPAAPLIGDLVAKAQDWPHSEEIAERLKMANPLFRPVAEPGPEQIKAIAEAELAKAETEGKQIENISALMTMMATLQGIPQTIEAMKGQIDQLVGAQQRQQPAEAPNGAAAAPPPEQAAPPAAEGEGEIVDMHEGAPV